VMQYDDDDDDDDICISNKGFAFATDARKG
jgi:hypothetical protein